MTCPKCGIELDPNDKFCWNCGTELEGKMQYKPKSKFSRALAAALIILIISAFGIGAYQYSNNELRNPIQFFENIVSENINLPEFFSYIQ